MNSSSITPPVSSPVTHIPPPPKDKPKKKGKKRTAEQIEGFKAARAAILDGDLATLIDLFRIGKSARDIPPFHVVVYYH